jgi:hypothetical protein
MNTKINARRYGDENTTHTKEAIMNSQQPNILYLDRRKEERRKLRVLQARTSGFEPNAFSRRTGADRRNTIVVYTDCAWT